MFTDHNNNNTAAGASEGTDSSASPPTVNPDQNSSPFDVPSAGEGTQTKERKGSQDFNMTIGRVSAREPLFTTPPYRPRTPFARSARWEGAFDVPAATEGAQEKGSEGAQHASTVP